MMHVRNYIHKMNNKDYDNITKSIILHGTVLPSNDEISIMSWN
jgi:hypothetical protein